MALYIMDSVLSYFGLSGGAIAIAGMLVFIVKRFLKSDCVRGPDGVMQLQVSLNNSELATIQQNEDLRAILQQLKDEAAKRSPRAVSPPPFRPTPVARTAGRAAVAV